MDHRQRRSRLVGGVAEHLTGLRLALRAEPSDVAGGELEHGWAFAVAAICDDIGEQVVLRLDREPPEATRRLMAVLGVRCSG